MDAKIKIEYEELTRLYELVNEEVFEKYILKPLDKELKDLKTAYSCKTLEELAELKGYYKGLKSTKGLLIAIEGRIKLLKEELNRYEK